MQDHSIRLPHSLNLPCTFLSLEMVNYSNKNLVEGEMPNSHICYSVIYRKLQVKFKLNILVKLIGLDYKYNRKRKFSTTSQSPKYLQCFCRITQSVLIYCMQLGWYMLIIMFYLPSCIIRRKDNFSNAKIFMGWVSEFFF